MVLTARYRHPTAVVADVLRVLALLSALVTLPTQPDEVPLRFGLMFALLLVTRVIAMPRPFDAAFAALMLVSGWASAAGWYFEHPWIDIPIHFALTGAAAAMLYFALARMQLLPKLEQPSLRRNVGAVVLVVALLGGTTAVVWEIYEWLAATFVQSRILVGYDDTIGDMSNGLLGSVVAGALMAWWQRRGHGLRARH
jgi:hypothetical protein